MDFAEGRVIKTGVNNYGVSYGDDTQTHAEFEQVAVQNNAKSEKEGCPQYDNVDFIRIMFPGDKTKIRFTKATEEHKQRFPKQWEAYKAGNAQTPSGFDIREWAILTKGEALDLKARGIHTVEQLAGLPDSVCSFFGAQNYREKAKLTLEKAKDGSVVLAIKAENDILKADIESLKEQLKTLATVKTKEKDKK